MAAVLARIERPQVGQPAPAEAVVDAHGRALRSDGHRHVFEVRTVGGGAALQEARRIGVGRIAVVGVIVDHLVVVQRDDPRMRCVRCLQINVSLVERMARAVLLQRVRCRHAVLANGVSRAGALVDVVADEQHEVQFGRRHVALRCKESLLVMLARGQRDAQAPDIGIGRRRGPGATDTAGRIARLKAIPVVAPGLQPLYRHVDAESARRPGHDFALAHRLTHCRVAEYFVAHRVTSVAVIAVVGAEIETGRQPGIGFECQPGPQHDAVGSGLAACNAQCERVAAPVRRGGGANAGGSGPAT